MHVAKVRQIQAGPRGWGLFTENEFIFDDLASAMIIRFLPERKILIGKLVWNELTWL